MSLEGILEAAAAAPSVQHLRDHARGPLDAVVIAPGAAHPLVAALLAAAEPLGAGRRLLAITATGRQADDLAAGLSSLRPELEVATFPSWETLPHERLSPSSDTVGRRLAVLRRLAPRPPGRRSAAAADPLGRGARADAARQVDGRPCHWTGTVAHGAASPRTG
ncbi:MAG: hypothetical protein ACKOE2_01540, partial [Actinomycetales bacterium]